MLPSGLSSFKRCESNLGYLCFNTTSDHEADEDGAFGGTAMGKNENCMNFQPLFMCERVLKVALQSANSIYDDEFHNDCNLS